MISSVPKTLDEIFKMKITENLPNVLHLNLNSDLAKVRNEFK